MRWGARDDRMTSHSTLQYDTICGIGEDILSIIMYITYVYGGAVWKVVSDTKEPYSHTNKLWFARYIVQCCIQSSFISHKKDKTKQFEIEEKAQNVLLC